MQYYYIASEWQWASRPFVLSVAKAPKATISPFNLAAGPTDDQLFEVEYNYDHPTPGIQFRHKTTGLYLVRDTSNFNVMGTPQFEDAGIKLVNGSFTSPGTKTLFTWGSVNAGGWSALRPHGRDDLNLNVQGGGTYTDGQAIIFYQWSGGYQNMQWKAILAP